jgi:hypothetical protein
VVDQLLSQTVTIGEGIETKELDHSCDHLTVVNWELLLRRDRGRFVGETVLM